MCCSTAYYILYVWNSPLRFDYYFCFLFFFLCLYLLLNARIVFRLHDCAAVVQMVDYKDWRQAEPIEMLSGKLKGVAADRATHLLPTHRNSKWTDSLIRDGAMRITIPKADDAFHPNNGHTKCWNDFIAPMFKCIKRLISESDSKIVWNLNLFDRAHRAAAALLFPSMCHEIQKSWKHTDDDESVGNIPKWTPKIERRVETTNTQ